MVSLAGWLVGPERLVAIVAAIVSGIWAIVAGLPAVIVGLVVLAAVTLAAALAHYSLALRDRFRHQQPGPGPTGKSHGILVEDSEGGHVEGNHVAGYEIGIGEYSSTDVAIRDNRIDTEVSGDQNINYGEQHVGINKGVVTFRETPPSVHLDGKFRQENEPQGDKFVTSFAVELRGRPPVLGVAVRGDNVEGVELGQDGPTSVLFNVFRGTTTEGFDFIQCGDPAPGIYIAEVQLSAPAKALEISLSQNQFAAPD